MRHGCVAISDVSHEHLAVPISCGSIQPTVAEGLSRHRGDGDLNQSLHRKGKIAWLNLALWTVRNVSTNGF
jgi:hypothetical protein